MTEQKVNNIELTDEWFNLGFKKGCKEVFEIMRSVCECSYEGKSCGMVASNTRICDFKNCLLMAKINKYLEDVK